MSELLKKLLAYSESDYYGFHMPGHKRNTGMLGDKLPYNIDITEIEDFDDLNHPRGILLDARKRASEAYGSDDTFFLVGGSTVGILSAVKATTNSGDTILVARNCHKSVYNAINLFALKAKYIYPEYDKTCGLYAGIDPNTVREIIENNENIRAMVMVSPTYDGVVSDIKEISGVLHEKGIPLILDEAHGAHFSMHPCFPSGGNSCGADIVINSLHKTMPALTQSAIMHVNGSIVDADRLEKTLYMLQSSSPSYVLMAGIDKCIDFMASGQGSDAFENYSIMLKRLRDALSKMTKLKLLRSDVYDISKIVISTNGTNIASYELYRRLYDDYHLQMEMVTMDYVLGMTSVCDTKEGMDRLERALLEIDAELSTDADALNEPKVRSIPKTEKIYHSYEINNKPVRYAELCNSKGCIVADSIYIYPPGIPILVPGERVSKECINVIQWYMKERITVEGVHENCIKVVKDE